MKILITGANGFLAYYLIEQLLQKQYTVIATAINAYRGKIDNPLFTYMQMDFTNANEVNAVLNEFKPTHIVHAGAISKPDVCEENKSLADKINIEGTNILLDAAQKNNCKFIFISTDFVFDGIKGMYKEEDERSAVNYYGQTKIAAEDLVMQYNNEWCIVRTALVYGKPFSGRNNMVTLVKEMLEKGEEYSVFDDQIRTCMYVEDLANAIVLVIQKNAKGIYHISGNDVLTPYQMAVATAEYLHLDKSLIKKVTEKDFSQPAKRPAKTGFVISKAKVDLGFKPISFAEGLKRTLE